MKLVFCVNRDLYANLALNTLVPSLAPHHTCEIFYSQGVANRRSINAGLAFLKFYEQTLINEWWFPLLEQHNVSLQPNPEAAPSPLLTFQQLSETYHVPHSRVNSLAELQEKLSQQATRPDLIISIRFGHIFKGATLQIPKLGIINLHSGILPQYRGVLATFWSLYHQQPEYGYTLHTITDASIDTGNILKTQRFAVQSNQSLFEHILALYQPGAQDILAIIQGIETDPHSLQGQAQSHEDSAYYSTPTGEEIEAFLKRGHSLLEPAAYFQFLNRYHMAPPFSFGENNRHTLPSPCSDDNLYSSLQLTSVPKNC